MARSARKAKCTVTITQSAAQELKSIQAANAKDEQHVLRIDTESEGVSLWLGPEQEGDTLVGSEDTVILRASPDLTKFLVRTSVVIDCMDHPDGTRLVVYAENDPPPEVSKPTKKTSRTVQKPKKNPKK